MPRAPVGPRRVTRTSKPASGADSHLKLNAELAKPAGMSGSAEAVRRKLEDAGLDPIAKLIEVIEKGTLGENMTVRALEILTNLVHAKQRPQDSEMEALKRRLEEGARFVILGEREDDRPEDWERRNAWRVPSAPVEPPETLQ